jgi:hypothetical protein
MKKVTERAVHHEIAELIDAHMPFTAYDVTVRLRNDGYHVPHNTCRAIVHKYPFPNTYDNKVVAIEPGVNATVFSPLAQSQTGTTTQFFPKFGSRDRISIFAKHLRDAQLTAGDPVRVDVAPGVIRVGRLADGRPSTIDPHNSLRIRKSDFKTAFQSVPSVVECSVKPGYIELFVP